MAVRFLTLDVFTDRPFAELFARHGKQLGYAA